MIFPSNEIYFCTSGDTRKKSLPVDKAYWNMTETYEMFTGDQTLLFDRFRRCLRGPARSDWNIIVHGITLEKATLETSLKKIINIRIRC